MSRDPEWTPKLTPKSRQKDFASLNLQIAKAYLSGIDNGVQTRTWQQALSSPHANEAESQPGALETCRQR